MKKSIIGALVGGILLTLWQTLSWTALNIHASQVSHTPHQDKILNVLSEVNLQEGHYFLPALSPDASPEEYKAAQANMIGKPWATLSYHHKAKMQIGMNLFRALIVNILSVFLVCYILLGDPNLSFQKVFLSCLSIGVIGYLTLPYLNSIWFETNSIPDLIDNIVQWALVGLALGKLLTYKKVNKNAVVE